MIHSSSGDPGEYTPDPGDWVWAQQFARDPAAAARFDHAVLGYETTPDDRTHQANAFLLASGGYARGALAPLPAKPGARPAWLLYVRVANLAQTVAKATDLGGEVRVKPKQVDPTTRLAIVRDPVGDAIGLIEFSQPAAQP